MYEFFIRNQIKFYVKSRYTDCKNSDNSAIPNFTLHNIAPLITLAKPIQILRCGGQTITKLERDNLLSL